MQVGTNSIVQDNCSSYIYLEDLGLRVLQSLFFTLIAIAVDSQDYLIEIINCLDMKVFYYLTLLKILNAKAQEALISTFYLQCLNS